MKDVLIVSSAIIPAVCLFFYIWRRDPIREPFSWLAKGFFYGAAICIPIAIVEAIIQLSLFGSDGPSTLIGTTIEAFFVAALPEESFKLLALWLLLRKNPYFDEHIDGIVYAVSVGLGFATIENIGYLYTYESEWTSVAISRALLAVPGHYAFAVIMGYYYSLYHFIEQSDRNRYFILLMPVLAHGIYDALALSGTVNIYVGGVSAIILIIFCIWMHRFALKKIIAHLDNDKRTSFEQKYDDNYEKWTFPKL